MTYPNHCAFYPGSVVQVLKDELKNYVKEPNVTVMVITL